MNDRNKKIIRIVLTVFLFPLCWIYYGIKIIEGFTFVPKQKPKRNHLILFVTSLAFLILLYATPSNKEKDDKKLLKEETYQTTTIAETTTENKETTTEEIVTTTKQLTTEIQTEPPTEPVTTQPPTEPPTEAPTEAITTQPLTEPPTTAPPVTAPPETEIQIAGMNNNQQQETVQASVDDQKEMVWKTKTGKCYHRIPNCGNTKSATQISKAQAEKDGLKECENCYQ